MYEIEQSALRDGSKVERPYLLYLRLFRVLMESLFGQHSQISNTLVAFLPPAQESLTLDDVSFSFLLSL